MLALLQEILQLVTNLATILGIVRNQTAKTAQENRPFEIDTATQETLAILVDPTFGPQALRNTLDTNSALATIQYNDLVARLALLQQAALPVVLPTIPPAGYAAPTVGANAAGVWAAIDGATGFNRGAEMSIAFQVAHGLSAQFMFTAEGTPGFWLFGDLANYNVTGGPAHHPSFETSSILATDTLLAYLLRTNPLEAWSDDYFGSGRVGADDTSGNWHWLAKISNEEFIALRDGLFGPGSRPLAPVWPGLAKVTLGAATALAPALTITAPMDGVIISLTGLPPQAGSYSYDGLKSFLNIGGLAFVDDNGQGEWFQALGFTDALYTPRLMSRAAAVKIRTAPGLVGTVQPWTIT
jgi:hypothetical protein